LKLALILEFKIMGIGSSVINSNGLSFDMRCEVFALAITMLLLPLPPARAQGSRIGASLEGIRAKKESFLQKL
jgi:hypothetical protein